MSFGEFLRWEQASRDVIDFKKIYVDIAGDLNAGLMLSEIIYWYLPSKETEANKLRVVHDNVYWIAVRRYEWWDRARLTPKQADRAIDILRDKQLIFTATYKFNGDPTTHIRLSEDTFTYLWGGAIENPPTNPYSPKGKNEVPERDITFWPKGETPLTENTPKNTTQPPSLSAGRKPVVNMNSKSKPEMGGDEEYYSDENAKPAARKKCALELRIEKEIPFKRKLSTTAANLLTLSVETSEGPQASPCILWDVNPYFPEWVEQRIAYWKTLSSSDATHLINLLRKYDNGEHGWLHFNEVKHKMKEAEDAKRTAYDPGDVPGIKSEQVDKDWSKVSWDDIEES